MNRLTVTKSLLRIFTVASFAVGIVAQAQEAEQNSTAKVEPQMAILVEYFEVDHRVANKLISEYSPQSSDVQGLRDRLGGMVESGEATLIETAWIRAKSGQRAKTESIRETIYPTEYDPPEIPNILGVVPDWVNVKEGEKTQPDQPPVAAEGASGDREVLMTSATPTAFETRNIGTTVEVDPVLSADGKLCTISLAPEMITLEGRQFYTRPDSKKVPWGVDHISMPLIYTMKTSLQLKAKPGNYNLLGLFTPPQKSKKKVIGLLKVDLIFAN